MTYIPPKNNKAKRLSLLFILTGLILVAISSILPYGVVFQIVAIALLIVGIQFLVKFVLSDYRYILEDLDDGTSELIIYRRQGRNDAKVCHVSLSSAMEIIPQSEKKTNADKRYNYCQNLTDTAQVIRFEDGDTITEVILEADESFLAALRERAGIGENRFLFMM